MSKKKDILIVDDTSTNISLLNRLLMGKYKTTIATNGAKALELAAASPPPDLVLLDIMMPEMDGYEVCKHLKANQATREIPVIFLTAKTEVGDETKGLAMGAVDYITKPISPPIVLERIKTQLNLREATIRLELLNKNLLEERDLIESIILKIQKSPLFNPSNLRILEKPLDKTTGDIICATNCAKGSRWVLLGDFTGHGLTAAIGGPLVSEIFYSDAVRGVPTGEMFRTLNERLLYALREDMFMACCCVELDIENRQVTMFNAGMPGIFIVRNNKVIHKEPSSFVSRGLMDVPDQEGSVFTVENGDRIIMCTDGLEETTKPGGEMFGNERFIQLLEKTMLHDSPLDVLIEEIQNYHQMEKLEDDISLVELTVDLLLENRNYSPPNLFCQPKPSEWQSKG
jgi:two-component system, HptB-dependent secretion and biofilm response regulator